MAEEEMEGPILFWGYKEQESNLILPEHDDDETLKIPFFKEFVTVATLQDVKRPEYSSPSLNTEERMSGVMPPHLHYIIACIRITLK
jgi:hypothetical protein